MGREFNWQKSAECEEGCVYYKRRDNGTEACEKVGYRLHSDWCDIAPDCDDFENEDQRAARIEREALWKRMEKKRRKNLKKETEI